MTKDEKQKYKDAVAFLMRRANRFVPPGSIAIALNDEGFKAAEGEEWTEGSVINFLNQGVGLLKWGTNG